MYITYFSLCNYGMQLYCQNIKILPKPARFTEQYSGRQYTPSYYPSFSLLRAKLFPHSALYQALTVVQYNTAKYVAWIRNVSSCKALNVKVTQHFLNRTQYGQ